MKKVVVLLVALGALYYFKPGVFPSFSSAKGAFDKKGNPTVLIFTAKECNGACERAMEDLSSRNVAFEEVQLDGNDENIKRYEKLGGTGTIPFILAGNHPLHGYNKGMLASTLGQTFGDRYLTRFEQAYYANHFTPDGTPIIYMYGASWCGYCKVLRDEMEKRHIQFAEVDVEQVPDKAALTDTMDIGGYPVTYVGYQRFVGGDQVEPVLAGLKTAGKRRI